MTLYKKTSTGVIQVWTIAVEGATILSESGKLDGKMVKSSDTIKSGKNLGRANATTAEEQAVLEATSRIDKKKKKGYVESLDDAGTGKVDAVIEGGIDPMLAHKFFEQGHKITYPAAVQPKLNGFRCIAINDGSGAQLWSRTRKRILSMPHICRVLSVLSHGHVATGPVVFDGDGQAKRCHEFHAKLEEHLALGYEGSIVRNFASPYGIGRRSYDLQKLKKFQDAEFEIVGVQEGRGKLQGHVGSFVLKLHKPAKDGTTTFDCKLKGPDSALREHWLKPPIGQMMTVRYFDYTPNGKPFHPVGVQLRDMRY